jgi:hypothetical protein
MSMKMIPPKAADAKGAMHKPAKMAPSPDPLLHPHSTFLAPTAATPTPAMDETREYVEETWAELRVHHMTQMAAPAEAHAKASNCTPAFSWNASMGILNDCQLAFSQPFLTILTNIPFLMVEAVRAPTAKAPVISKTKHRSIACRYVTEREDTEVAQALATSSVLKSES